MGEKIAARMFTILYNHPMMIILIAKSEFICNPQNFIIVYFI